MSSRSSNSLKAFKARVYDEERDLSLVESQSSVVYTDDIQHILVSCPSLISTPTFGSPVSYKLSERNICLNDTSIVVNTSALSGLTGGAPRVCAGTGIFAKIDYKVNGTILDSAYPEFTHILNQVMNTNDDRQTINNGVGSYSSSSQRTTMATKTNQYIIALNSLFNFANFPILNPSHEVEIVMTLKTLPEIVVLNGATGTPVMSITSSFLQCRVSKIAQWLASHRLEQMAIHTEDTMFHSTKPQSFTVNAGLSSVPLTLSNMSKSKIAALFFVVRPTSSLNGDGHSTYAKISSFALRDSMSNSISGSQDITDAMALNYLSQFWSQSTVQSETSTGSQLNGLVTDLGQNIYCYSHSSNICDAYKRGRDLSCRSYEGNETLTINFTSVLTTGVTVDVFCLCQSVLRQGVNTVSVSNLPSPKQ